MRLSRWRPVCPECGYSLRKLTQPRCPECGEPFPTTQKTFRRWAVRRLPWDRTHRSPLILTYLKTLLLILFCPWKAGRSLAVPDRMGRAVRWALVHIILIAACGTLLGAMPYYIVCIQLGGSNPDFFHPAHYLDRPDPPDRLLVWALQSLAAWILMIGAQIGLAALIGSQLPNQHLAARRGAIKWSLYCVPTILLTIAVWYGYYAVNPPTYEVRPLRGPYPLVPADLLAGIFGLSWAVGVSCNPYDRIRRIRSFLLNGTLYLSCWYLLTRFLFPVGPLEAMR